MDLAALLYFICLGIGRLDLLASVELCRDPDLSHGGELDICPLAPQTGQRGSPRFQGEAVFLASLCPPALERDEGIWAAHPGSLCISLSLH